MAVAATKEERREKKAKTPATDASSDGSSGPRVEENPDPGEVPESQDPPAEAPETTAEVPTTEDKNAPKKNRSSERATKRSRAGPCAAKVCGAGATCVPTEENRRKFKCQCGTGLNSRFMPPAIPCPTKSSHRTSSWKEDRPRQRRRQGSRGRTRVVQTPSSSSSSSSSLSSSSSSNTFSSSSDAATSLSATPDRSSICETNPCGKEPACHPDDTNPRGFICVCINSSHVAPGASCEHTLVNVTPSAVPLPLQNASGFQTRALQKSGGLQNTGALQNTRQQQFELSPPGPLGVASSPGLGMALMFCLATLMLLLLSAIAFWRRKTIADVVRRRRRVSKGSAQVLPMSLMKDRNFASNPNYYAEPLEPTSPFQALAVQLIDKEQISFVGQLGEGCFGKVYKGVYGPRDVEGRAVGGQTVAVKVLKESAGGEAEADFLREVEIMAAFTHTNILTLVGIVAADGGGPPWMVFEYMALGDLAELLRSRSPEYRTDDSLSKTMTKDDLVSVSVQIAAGMTYLSSQHFVHRDLACRNCLVGDNLAVKISDFGMSRDIYTCDYYKMGGSRMLPVRWMSPESLVYGKFTLESDVWSFGVVLWEIYAFGKQPYYGHTNEEVLKLILQGILLQPPKGCPPPICDVMRKCWSSEARDRLQFSQIEDLLLKIQKGADPSRAAGGMPESEIKSLSPEQARHLEQTQQQHLQQQPEEAWGGVTYSELMAQAEGEIVDTDDYLMPRVHPPVEYLTVLNVD